MILPKTWTKRTRYSLQPNGQDIAKPHPRVYLGGESEPAQEVAAKEAHTFFLNVVRLKSSAKPLLKLLRKLSFAFNLWASPCQLLSLLDRHTKKRSQEPRSPETEEQRENFYRFRVAGAAHEFLNFILQFSNARFWSTYL
ncbi:hypothetical protein [uncultured Nostoc sp.]|uniref:hypothetical protein n=1 Tax=uncultured Nostoc sp. TaxID=340711 RepID=UPI0035CBCC0D